MLRFLLKRRHGRRASDLEKIGLALLLSHIAIIE